MSKKFFSEVLDAANKAENPSSYLAEAIKNDSRIVNILGYAANPVFRIANQIPEGCPPHKESDLPLGLASVNVLDLHNKLYIVFNENLKAFKKEEHFIRWCESMHPTDVKILCAIKDQKLETLYPNITKLEIAKALGWDLTKFQEMLNKTK